METQDLLLFDELYDHAKPSHNYFSIEQELIETKNKLKILEDRLNKLEICDRNSNNTLSMIPMRNPIRNTALYFCDVNCKEMKIDENLYIFMDDCLFCDIWDLNLIGHYYDESNPSVRFLQQFKNVKTFIIDLSCSFILEPKQHQSNSRSTEIFINICKIITESNSNYEIIFKCRDLHQYGDRIEKLFNEICMKSTSYKKLTIELKNNLINNSGYPYLRNTQRYCIKHNIEFLSNIGL